MSAVYNDRTTAENPLYIVTEVQGSHLAAYDPPGLANLMDAHPDLGIRHLYRKAISSWLRPVNQYLFTTIESIMEEEYPRDGQAGLVKALYVLDPERPFRGVDDGTYRTSDEIAECLERNFDHYEKELQSPTAPLYLFLEARDHKEEADRFRELFRKTRPAQAALNAMILSLQSAETGPVLKLGKFVAAEPREILLAEQSIQDRVAQDLADPYSKVSLWLQHFPHLAGSVARYRALGRSRPERLLTALSKSAVEKKKRRKAMGVQEVSAHLDVFVGQYSVRNELDYIVTHRSGEEQL